MELGFDFANELRVKVAMETEIHPSSPTVAGLCFVVQRRSCCCSKRKAASILFSLFLVAVVFLLLLFCLYFLFKNN